MNALKVARTTTVELDQVTVTLVWWPVEKGKSWLLFDVKIEWPDEPPAFVCVEEAGGTWFFVSTPDIWEIMRLALEKVEAPHLQLIQVVGQVWPATEVYLQRCLAQGDSSGWFVHPTIAGWTPPLDPTPEG